jgi:hypothetical protein
MKERMNYLQANTYAALLALNAALSRASESGLFDAMALAGIHPDNINQFCDEVERFEKATAAIVEPDNLVYLTNACGEDTGFGDQSLTATDRTKVVFESGPGTLLLYIVEFGGSKYVLANLEVAYKDGFWRDENDFMAQDEAREYCSLTMATIATRLTDGALLLSLDEDDPGRMTIRVAVPLSNLSNAEHTSRLMTQIFGIENGIAASPWVPVYSKWRHGGWYVSNLRYPAGHVGCVSNNYPDKKWRIVCDDRRSALGEPGDFTFASRDAAARAEYQLVQAMQAH